MRRMHRRSVVSQTADLPFELVIPTHTSPLSVPSGGETHLEGGPHGVDALPDGLPDIVQARRLGKKGWGRKA